MPDAPPRPQPVPPEGSLALLAYGDLGVIAWRRAREAAGLSRCSHTRPLTPTAGSKAPPNADAR